MQAHFHYVIICNGKIEKKKKINLPVSYLSKLSHIYLVNRLLLFNRLLSSY